MKRTLVAAAIAWTVFQPCQAPANDKTYTMGVLCWSTSQDHRDALEGFTKVLQASGVRHRFLFAESAADKAKPTLRKWKEEKIDLICTVGTEATELAMAEVQDIPIVFLAVTHPVLSGIAGRLTSC